MNDMPVETARKSAVNEPMIIDMGKRSRKAVRALRKGKGVLLHKIDDHLQRLSEIGEISADHQPVVIIVRPKSKRKMRWF